MDSLFSVVSIFLRTTCILCVLASSNFHKTPKSFIKLWIHENLMEKIVMRIFQPQYQQS